MEGVLHGRNGTVFCYGATGAGKTYTMLGTMENPGVMVLAIKDLFSKVRQRSHDGNHSIQLSYLEIYNETVRDLLSPGRPLHLREDKQVRIEMPDHFVTNESKFYSVNLITTCDSLQLASCKY